MRTALALAGLLVASAPARAQGGDELAEARRLEAALDYAGALALIQHTIAHGGSDPGRLAELHLLAGRLAAGLDRPQLAADHFARLLALRPDTVLPAGTSPKITAPFAAARARTLPLRVSVTSVKGLVTLLAEADALGLVAGIQVAVVDPNGQHRDVVERHATRIAIPGGTTAIEVAALDSSGNRIWLGTVPPEPVAVVTTSRPLPPPPPPPHRTSWIARGSTWGVLSMLALGTGGFAAWRFSVAQHDWDQLHLSATHDFTDLKTIEARGRRWGMTANIGLGVGAATGLAALILYLRDDRSEPRLTAGPGPGTGVSLSARF